MKLRNITESLEKKYNLNESKTLNEKLSPDMPEWLAKRLLTTKYTDTGDDFLDRDLTGAAHYPGKGTITYRQRAKEKNPEFGQTPAYKQLEVWDGDQSLFTKMLDADINLDNVKVIEGPIPTSKNDKRLKPPNIPIFLFDNGVVYARGLNDNEKLGSRKSLGAYSIDSILAQCKKFAYIDGSDDDNFHKGLSAKRREQRENSIYRLNGPEKDRDNKSLGDANFDPFHEYDKSGYVTIPTVEKYENKLNEIKAGKIYDILKGYEDYLKIAQQEYANYISSISIEDFTGEGDDTVEDIYTSLYDAIKEFINIRKYVDRILNNSLLNDQEKRDEIIDIITGSSLEADLEELDEYITELKDMTKKVFNSTIDWI